MQDPYRLGRFTQAQDQHGVYQRAVAELRAGRKASHWMWFVFPQIAGLGLSAMSREFAISSLAEARAYLRHPVLGPRLIECATIVADTEGKSAADVFGSIDAMKLRSSMTLFMAAVPGEDVPGEEAFARVLDKYFGGVPDEATLTRLRDTPSPRLPVPARNRLAAELVGVGDRDERYRWIVQRHEAVPDAATAEKPLSTNTQSDLSSRAHAPGAVAGDAGRMRSVWEIIGITLAALLAVGGLAFVGFLVFLYIGLSSWASNK